MCIRHLYMQVDYVHMQDNYVYMQDNCVYMLILYIVWLPTNDLGSSQL